VWKGFVVMIPLLGAILVAISRIMDYRHHPWDVVFGGLLGKPCLGLRKVCISDLVLWNFPMAYICAKYFFVFGSLSKFIIDNAQGSR